VFWIVCVWIIVTGSASVIRQIFFPPPDAAPTPGSASR
jgi:hypothetical protein